MPSDLNCIFTLAARGVYADIRLEYVNQLETRIHETYARPTQYSYAVYVRLFPVYSYPCYMVA